MIKIAINNRFTGAIVFEYESHKNNIKTTVRELLKKYAGEWIKEIDLSGEDLGGIDFSNSKFYNSKFYNSTFYNSKFYNSKFDNSTFDNSTFDNSKFYNSTFYNSTFYNSTFYNSTFYNSKFDNSTFDNSTFDNSTFDEASGKSALESGGLDSVKTDFFGRMLILKNEVHFLKQSLIDGKIDGSSYSGECSCFMGTIAKSAKCNYKSLALKPDSSSDTERWFMGIKKGYTPENNQIAKITLGWIEEFERLIKI